MDGLRMVLAWMAGWDEEVGGGICRCMLFFFWEFGLFWFCFWVDGVEFDWFLGM